MHQINYLNNEEPKLGDELFFIVDELQEQIGENPLLWQIAEPNTKSIIRRAHLPKFKNFSIHFAVDENTVYLLGLYHDREDPKGWRC